MDIDWKQAFSHGAFPKLGEKGYNEAINVSSLPQLKSFFDEVHIRHCLLRPYCENPDYPVVESRELLPSFETELWEYKGLPGFSMVVFDRELESFNEIFQYNILYPTSGHRKLARGESCPAEGAVAGRNLQTIMARLPKQLQGQLESRFRDQDVTALGSYPLLLPYLLSMDRAQVFARDAFGRFYMAGVFASFPSDFDGELKRFGLQIGKFKVGDNAVYERNRLFVNQYLMELYGFPIASERRTSSALFARRLHKLGEKFMIRVLGQSDRVLTTIWSDGTPRRYPWVEKIALVRLTPERTDLIEYLDREGCFVDRTNLVIILRIVYKQHVYHASNIRQDRALSVATQEVIHPLTGERFTGLNVIHDSSTLLLNLNDIVRGEYLGRVVYKRTELIENTDTVEKRLKMLYAWLSKNQRRIIGYGDEFYAGVTRILDSYLYSAELTELPSELTALKHDVEDSYAYIRQARHIHAIASIASREYKGKRLSYLQMLQETGNLLHELKFDLGRYFDELLKQLISNVERLLNDRYIQRKYIDKPEKTLTAHGREMRKAYQRIVSLLDELRGIRKVHAA